MSVYRQLILDQLELNEHDIAVSGRGGLVYSASAGAAREQGFGVVPDPIDPPRQPIDPAHTLVKAAPEWTKGDRKRRMTALARAAVLTVGEPHER